MTYAVEVTARATSDIDEIYGWLHARAPEAADRWYDRIHRAMKSLAEMPERCRMALESRQLGVNLRHLIAGKYRIIFRIDSHRVVVVHVRHGRRRPLSEGDLP
jgi:plasmid stabilization system protein ParE